MKKGVIIGFICVAVIIYLSIVYYSDKTDSRIDSSIQGDENQVEFPSNYQNDSEVVLQKEDKNTSSANLSKNDSLVTLSIDKQSDRVFITAETFGNIYISDSRFPKANMDLYRFVQGAFGPEWVQLVHSIPLAYGPSCKLASLKETFEWDKRYTYYQQENCGNEMSTCLDYKEAEPGRYKVVYRFVTNCSVGEPYEWDIQKQQSVEKEFSI